MAAPSFVGAGSGALWTTGSAVAVTKTGCTTGNLVFLQVLVDNTSGFAPVLSSISGVANLAGTANSWTNVGLFSVGGGMGHYIQVGRATGSTVSTSIEHASGDDCYARIYEFQNASTGTTLATVIENGTAGSTAVGSGTTAAITAADVTTLGADRLAVQFVAVNDDNAVDPFTGMSGGTWAEATAEYASSTGTDGCIQLQTANMASAGTISGGSYTMAAADGWGVVAFALIGTTSSGTTYSGSVTANATILKVTESSVTANAQIKNTIASSVTADSYVKRIWGTGETTSVRAVGTEAGGTTANLSVSIPGSAQAGDFLVLYQVWDRTTAVGRGTAPSGWTYRGGIEGTSPTVGWELGTAVYYRHHNGSDTTVDAPLASAVLQRGVVVAFTGGVANACVVGSWIGQPANGTGQTVVAQDAAFSYYHEVLPTTLVVQQYNDSFTNDPTQTIIHTSTASTLKFQITQQPFVRATSLTSVPSYSYTVPTTQALVYTRLFVNNTAAPGVLTADAAIRRTFSGSFSADANIDPTSFPGPVWVSPADTASHGATPTLVFTIPNGGTGNYHFHLQLDTANTFNTGSLRELKTSTSTTGWEYYNGSTWTAFPTAGVPSTYIGNDVRHTVQSALPTGVWYRRVRGGK